MLNLILPLALALSGGVGGFLLRRWELAAAFDENGLAIGGAAPTLLLIALSAVLAGAFFLLCRKPRYVPSDYSQAFGAQNNWPYLIAMTLSAAMLLVAGLLGLKNAMVSFNCGLLCKLTCAMCILSFFCVLTAAWTNFRGKPLTYSLPLLVPGYTLCLWLVNAYQQQAAEPVVLIYVYEVLAIICALLGLYFSAGYSFGRPKFCRCAVFSLLGIYFILVTLADPHTTPDRLMLLFALLYLLANLFVFLYRAFLFPVPTQINHTQEVTPDE